MDYSSVKIRKVKLDDAESLQKYCFPLNTIQQVIENLKHYLEDYSKGVSLQLVIDIDGSCVGSALLVKNSHPLHLHRGELFSFVINEEYQGKGLSRCFIKSFLIEARIMKISLLELSCRAGTQAEKIYPKLGFIEYGRLPSGIQDFEGKNKQFDQVFFYQKVFKQ